MTDPANDIRAALAHIPAHDRDTWVCMAMAVKSELGEAGFTLWNDWSQSADSYQPKAARAVWKSIKAGGKVSIASLFHEAHRNGWQPSKPYTPPTAEQRQQIEAARLAAQQQAEQETERLHAEAKAKAAKLWAAAGAVRADHPYLIAKGIKPVGAKQLRGMLVLPLRAGGELVSLQLIGEDGGKRFLTGGQVKGTALTLGSLKDATEILLCEGWATGCTLHEATGLPVVVAWNAGNLAGTAERLAAALPAAALRVCGDADASGTGQQAAHKAAEVHGMAVWCVPSFTPEQCQQRQENGKDATDFNDLHQLAGLDAVRAGVLANVMVAEPDNGQHPASTPDPLPDASNEDAYIQHLAGLSLLNYGRQRKAAAEALGGVPLGILDKLVNAARKEAEAVQPDDAQGTFVLFEEVEAWPEPVSGDAVLSEALALLQRYVIADKETLRAAVLWCALTWLVDRATVLPLALISAPEKGCGKSVLLEALSHLCFKPLPVASVSAAGMFRAIEKWRPTLFIDEVDTFMRDNPELVGVINSGHTRRNAFVLRTVGEDFEPKAFSTWCAKALSGIAAKNLTDSLVSRSVIFNLRRKLPSEKVAPLRRESERHFIATRRKLARWADDNGEAFSRTVPEPFGLNNRAADNWEGLVAIADLAGGHWPSWARHAAHHIAGSVDAAPSVNQELLTDIQAVFERRKVDKLHTAQLLSELCSDDESAWATYNRGRELTAKQLKSRLKEFGIEPKQTWIAGEGNRNGYEIGMFKEAFSRYLGGENRDGNLRNFPPPNQHQQQDDGLSFLSPADSGKSPSRTLDANNHAGYSRFSDSRTPSPLEGGKPLQANNHAGSSVLEGETPQTAERKENSIEIEGVDYEIF